MNQLRVLKRADSFLAMSGPFSWVTCFSVQPGNGAIIVDPGLGAVVAWGYDGTGSCCSSVNFGSHSSATVPIKGSGRDPEEHQNSPVMASIETMLSSEPILERGRNSRMLTRQALLPLSFSSIAV